MNKPWQDKLRRIDPYVPGEQSKDPDIIKLNANENPYAPSPRVAGVLRSFSADRLRKYPDANSGVLRTALAKHFEVDENQIFMGNGSDDVLALCFQAFFCSDKPILFPDLTYSFYPVWCSLFRTPYETVPLDENYRIHPEDYARDNGGVVLPNPNAPTASAKGWTLSNACSTSIRIPLSSLTKPMSILAACPRSLCSKNMKTLSWYRQ